MKKILVILILLTISLTGCATKNLERRVDDLNERVAHVEKRQGKLEDESIENFYR